MHASDASVREIPLDKLAPSPANVRRTDLEAGLLELAASIAAHGLLQPPVVTPERDDAGQETGRYLVTAGERRRKALLLVEDKRLTRTAPVRCPVRSDGNPTELGLAESTLRLSMHPTDQLAAFAGVLLQRPARRLRRRYSRQGAFGCAAGLTWLPPRPPDVRTAIPPARLRGD